MAVGPPVPHCVKHVTISVLSKGQLRGTTRKEKFLSAYAVARARLQEYGYIQNGPGLTAISLTYRGFDLERKHQTDNPGKSETFDALWVIFDVTGEQARKKKKEAEEEKRKQKEEQKKAAQAKAVIAPQPFVSRVKEKAAEYVKRARDKILK